MTWRSFMDYVIMLELGQHDAVYRNYDIGNLNGSKPGIVLDRAFAMMGFDQKNTPRAFVLPAIRAQLTNVGYPCTRDDDWLAERVREWYNWHRIRSGMLQQWPLKRVDNPLL